MNYILAIFIFALGSHYSYSTTPKEDILKELQTLYPHLSSTQLNEKIKTSSNVFKFFRSFVPYFYKTAKDLQIGKDSQDPLNSISHEMGWCVGDAHLENFGSVVDQKNFIEFRANDIDDSARCPLFLDLLRFLVSYTLIDEKFDESFLNDVLESYKKGLNAKEYKFSKVTLELLNEAGDKKLEAPKHMLEEDDRLYRTSPDQEVDLELRNQILAIIENSLGEKLEFVDIIKYVPSSGGSSHLLRYRILVKFPSNSNLLPENAPKQQLLELKTLAIPGVFPVLEGELPKSSDRIKESLTLIRGAHASPILRVLEINQCDMLLRPRWAAEINIEIKGLSKDEIKALIVDEAYTLGRIHSLSASENFISQVTKSQTISWQIPQLKLSDKITKSFKLLK
ncbi:MAG: DUF2252 family protein [Proteobacteria bacterium]|nr:DUF2252 family protein [Pseudomonadota bacterium]